MSKRDLDRFIEKVNSLNSFLKSVEDCPSRRKVLIECSTHEEVVQLAREWGYEIGRRWGE